MRRRFSAGFVICALIAGGLTVTACAVTGQSTNAQSDFRQDDELGRIRTAVERALSSAPPRGYAAVPPGVQLLGLARQNDRIVLDFSGELLAGGTGRVLEDALHQIFTAASSVRAARGARADDYLVLVNGDPLDTYLR